MTVGSVARGGRADKPRGNTKTAATSTHVPAERRRPLSAAVPLAAAGLVVTALLNLAANWDVKKGDNGGLQPALVTAAICVVLTAFLFGYVVPRAKDTNRTALILGILGFLSFLVFWSGVAPILTAAAFAVAPRSAGVERRATVGQVLGVVGTVISLVIVFAQTNLF
jgi:hypothetical protein